MKTTLSIGALCLAALINMGAMTQAQADHKSFPITKFGSCRTIADARADALRLCKWLGGTNLSTLQSTGYCPGYDVFKKHRFYCRHNQ